MTKIGGVKREGLFTRELSGATPYFIFEIEGCLRAGRPGEGGVKCCGGAIGRGNTENLP